jgi:hypothetical protein
LDAGLTTSLCKKITVAKLKEVKTGRNVAEYPKVGYSSKKKKKEGAVLHNDNDL